MFPFLKIKASPTWSLFFGTTNLKRAVTPKHGAVWGIDTVLNYLKEINNASCPWRATSVRRAISCLLVRNPCGGRVHFSAP